MENGKQAQEEIRPMQSGPGSSKSENKTRRVMQRHANDEAEACLLCSLKVHLRSQGCLQSEAIVRDIQILESFLLFLCATVMDWFFP